jgi:small-conductance mechanosensitive channel
MTTGRLARLLMVALALALLGAMPASAQHPAAATGAANPGGLTAAEAQRALEILQDPKKRAQLIETLHAIAKAAPPPISEKPAASQPGPAAPGPAVPAVALEPDSLGAQLLSQLSSWPERLAGEAAAATRAITDFPLLWGWAERFAADPDARLAMFNALWQLALVMACVLLLEWLVRVGLARPIAALASHTPNSEPGNDAPVTKARAYSAGAWHLLRRLPFALARLALDLIPVGVFWGAGSFLAGITPAPLPRFAILVVVNAYAASRIIMAVGIMLVSPAIGRLRLLEIGDDAADYLIRWLRRITTVAVSGGALASLALLLGLNDDAYDTLIHIVALIVAVLLGILVLRSRRAVALRLRAPPRPLAQDAAREGASGGARSGVAVWRNWLAGAWHYLALTLIVAGWIVLATGIRNGLGGLRLLIGTVVIAVAARLVAIVVLGMLDRAANLSPELTQRLPGAAARAARYHAPTRFVLRVAIVVATGILMLQFWGADAFMWFEGDRIGGRLVSALLTIAVAAVAAIIVWEGTNAALERRLARLSKAGPAAHSARLRTLLPMLRAALLSVILAVVGLTALSEIGVNIAPLLAGAGVIGIAVGFGGQKLVQDVITGMFVLFENAIQIGDWVTVAGLSGDVERLSIRNIWLRGNDGAVHIIPFSAVTSITNTNRGLGNAAVSVTVAYKEDSDHVAEVLSAIAAEMRADPAFAPLMLGDLTLWVDAVKAAGVTHAGLIACTDAGRWPVQREFNRRLQKRFQELGIELGSG